MGVGNLSQEYLYYLPQWKFCRDAVSGQDAVKRAGEAYLPKPAGMDKDEYEAYKSRAEWFNATGRTLEGLHGMMFRKPPDIAIDDALSQLLENVDGEGTAFEHFANDVTWDCAITGFGGVLVGAPYSEGVSRLAAEEGGLLPYMTFYNAERIINRHFATIGRRRTLDLVVLAETEEVKTAPYTYDTRIRHRVCELDADGYYMQTVYDENEAVLSQVYPLKYGQRMHYIPFFFMPNNKPYTPMMKSIADVNMAWYRKSADIENGAHWTGVPTPYSIGYVPEAKVDEAGHEVAAEVMKLGGSNFLYFPEGCSVGFLEFAGAGLARLAEMMKADEDRMAILGARIISAERNGVEAAETARIHRAGENSVLATFAREMSSGLTSALREYIEWCTGKDAADDVHIAINTDYDAAGMSSGELTALVSCWQAGGISKRVLFQNMKQGELIEDALTFDDMQEEIDEEGKVATAASDGSR